jgi:hypothetical protein
MKVNDIGAVPGPTPSAPRREVSNSPADKVSTPALPPPSMAASARDEQVRAIVASVKGGTYQQPTAQEIADQIVDAAELDARLRSLLGGG